MTKKFQVVAYLKTGSTVTYTEDMTDTYKARARDLRTHAELDALEEELFVGLKLRSQFEKRDDFSTWYTSSYWTE
jgi:hypothetical protein